MAGGNMSDFEEVIAAAKEAGLRERFKCAVCGTPHELKYRGHPILEAVEALAARCEKAEAALAEAMEREPGRFWRQFKAERDDLRAELAEIEKRQEWANPTERDDLRAKLAAAEARAIPADGLPSAFYTMRKTLESERDAALARANKAEWKYEEGHLVWIDMKKDLDAALARVKELEEQVRREQERGQFDFTRSEQLEARVAELEGALRELLGLIATEGEFRTVNTHGNSCAWWRGPNRCDCPEGAAVARARRVLEKIK